MNTISVLTLMPQTEEQTKDFVEKTKSLVLSGTVKVSELEEYLKQPTQAIRELNLWVLEKSLENF